MPLPLNHELKIDATADETARQGFVTALRDFVLHDMAGEMRQAYDSEVKPKFVRQNGREPADAVEVHRAMKGNPVFSAYSAMRVTAQELVWDSVADMVERNAVWLRDRAKEINEDGTGGTVKTTPGFEIPRSVSSLDVHFMPGNYETEYLDDDAAAGAFYENGFSVFSMGLMGENFDDIGGSISAFIKRRFPDFKPQRILDLGCTIGHNTVPWARNYPDAQVTAIDVAPPVMRYGSARAKAFDVHNIDFVQMDATKIDLPDNSVDLVWSSMFLHEVPPKQIHTVLQEAYRVLKPGGLMLHMELPPNEDMTPYDGFFLDWDSWYNKEPYYKAFRDFNLKETVAKAGFDIEKFVKFTVPSLAFYGTEGIEKAVAADADPKIDQNTGTLNQGLSWFCFGAWK